MDFVDVPGIDGEDNMGGTLTKIYYAKASEVATWPTIVPGATPDTLVTLSGDITMNVGKTFKEMYVTIDKNKIDDKSVGEYDGKSYEHILEYVHPGSKATILGTRRLMNNTNMVFLVPEADGRVRMVGSEQFPAKADNLDGTTGAATADFKHNKFVFKSRGVAPAYIYSGVIPST